MKIFIPKFLSASALLAAGILFSLNGYSQTQVKPANADAVKPAANLPQNPDIAPPPAEKPYIIGENGEKIYFLTDPYKNSGGKKESNNAEAQKEKVAPVSKPEDENKPK